MESYLLEFETLDGYLQEVEVPDPETALGFVGPMLEDGSIRSWKLYKVVITRTKELIDEG